jgi:hypothetical protein
MSKKDEDNPLVERTGKKTKGWKERGKRRKVGRY